MPFIKDLNNFAAILLDILKNLGRGKAWLSLLIYATILGAVLVAHFQHLSPLFYGPVHFLTSLISSDLSERFYHYPSHFLYLPWFYGWAKLVLSVLLEGIFLGTAALAFWYGYQRKRSSESLFKTALRRWPHFIAVSIIFNGLITLASYLLPQIFHSMLISSPRRQLVFEFAVLPAIYCILLALFFVAIPAVAVRGDSFLKAIKRSFALALHRPFSLLILSILILVVPLLLSAAANRPEVIIEKFRPDLVFVILLVGLVVEMIANYIWMAAAVRFLADDKD